MADLITPSADSYEPGRQALCHLLGKLDAAINFDCTVSLPEVRADLEAIQALLRTGWQRALRLDLGLDPDRREEAIEAEEHAEAVRDLIESEEVAR